MNSTSKAIIFMPTNYFNFEQTMYTCRVRSGHAAEAVIELTKVLTANDSSAVDQWSLDRVPVVANKKGTVGLELGARCLRSALTLSRVAVLEFVSASKLVDTPLTRLACVTDELPTGCCRCSRYSILIGRCTCSSTAVQIPRRLEKKSIHLCLSRF